MLFKSFYVPISKVYLTHFEMIENVNGYVAKWPNISQSVQPLIAKEGKHLQGDSLTKYKQKLPVEMQFTILKYTVHGALSPSASQ